MGLSIPKKIRIFCKSISVLRNWYAVPTAYFRLTNEEFVVFKTRNGLKIKLRVNSTDFMQFVTVWLQREYDRPNFEIKNNDTVIDVGAHIGLFTLFAAQNCKKGTIYSFEPIKENYEVLLSQIAINSLANVIPLNAAVTNREGSVKIYLNEDDSGHSISSVTNNSVQVESKSLNSFLEREIKRCDFLKLDCEGAEYEIIESLTRGSMDKIEKMCIEYHNAVEHRDLLDNLLRKLRDAAYDVTVKSSSEDMGLIYAKKQA